MVAEETQGPESFPDGNRLPIPPARLRALVRFRAMDTRSPRLAALLLEAA